MNETRTLEQDLVTFMAMKGLETMTTTKEINGYVVYTTVEKMGIEEEE